MKANVSNAVNGALVKLASSPTLPLVLRVVRMALTGADS